MRNPHIYLPKQWNIKKDNFHDIDPFDDAIDDENKFNNLYCQEELLWLSKLNSNIDLGWYGKENDGNFTLYLYKGDHWHHCQLLEKRQTNNYPLIIKLIHQFIENVDLGKYDSINMPIGSIDDYWKSNTFTALKDL